MSEVMAMHACNTKMISPTEVQKIIHMNEGDGKYSYAQNSLFQRTVMRKVKPILEDSIRSVIRKAAFPRCLRVADLGCGSGPNTILVITQIIHAMLELRRETSHTNPAELQVFLNDLPRNDFNNVFKLLHDFHEKDLKQIENGVLQCFVAGVSGSFHGRLFPAKTLHFAHSTYSVQWLSQIPEGIENNKGNVFMSESSPENVFESYANQFQKDFSSFLSSRAKEIILGGEMVLAFLGRGSKHPTAKDCCQLWDLFATSLQEIVQQGRIDEEDVHSLNWPFYAPFSEEVREIVENEGSFDINMLETLEINWDPYDSEENKDYIFNKVQSGENVANYIRAVTEPIIAAKFGEDIVDDLYKKFAKHVGDHLSMEKTKHISIVISMTKI